MTVSDEPWFVPDWPVPPRVCSLITTRRGGVSLPPFDSFNLGAHVGDHPAAVAANRRMLTAVLPGEPFWLNQVHGTTVVEVFADKSLVAPKADAAYTRATEHVCAVMTADCLPVLFCDIGATVVAVAHAGWRGLQAGILEATVSRLPVSTSDLSVYLGPAIGPQAFVVGDEVREAFVAADGEAAASFTMSPFGDDHKWLADMYRLARLRLRRLGVARIHGGGECTFANPQRYFSYRRDGTTGRMASFIWLSAR
ncbi:MAG: peptidoglycan editing factor PgeF [Candidatus Accumulibacter sp.]|nr:peptidoglycan editing factor PgeF [Accumulibacter sp.]